MDLVEMIASSDVNHTIGLGPVASTKPNSQQLLLAW
jgi:hypothetical protein